MGVEISVISKPEYIEFDCPNCGKNVKIPYNEFVDIVGYPVYWKWSTFSCPECEGNVDIDTVEWEYVIL